MSSDQITLHLTTPAGRSTERLRGQASLGRAPDCSVQLAFSGISRRHASLEPTHDGWVVRDLESHNGTFVNDERVEVATLSHGDRVRLGPATLVVDLTVPVVVPGAPEAPGASQVTIYDAVSLVALDDFPPAAAVSDVVGLRRDYDTLRAAHELAHVIGVEGDIDRVLVEILQFCFKTLSVDTGVALLRDHPDEPLRPRQVQCRSGTPPTVLVSRNVLDEVLTTRSALLVSDVSAVARFGNAESIVLGSIQSVLAVPLVVDGEVLGVLVLDSREQDAAFKSRDLHVLAGIAAQAALALQRVRLTAALAEAAAHRQRIAQQLVADAQERLSGFLLGNGDAMVEARRQLQVLAPTAGSVSITGPSGSGTEAAARAIHDASARRERAFIYLDCARVVMEQQRRVFPRLAELADPGASVAGARLELARGGTLFLDGVDNLTTETRQQLALLVVDLDADRASQTPVLDIRVLMSASRDAAPLQAAAQLALPPLVDRPDDIGQLVAYFTRWHARRLGKRVGQVSQAALARLQAHRWPGDVHELKGVLERAVLEAPADTVEVDDALLAEMLPLGRYHLVERIGEGGMGEVWRARHLHLARPAAVKLVLADTLEGGRDRAIARFLQEAEITASLRSPHTVELYDFGVSDSGTLYYVMELLEGLDLQRMVQRFGPMPAERVVVLLQQVCRSLAEAHDAGLVHRDIKPANIYITKLGHELDFAKVLDFGIARRSTQGDVEGEGVSATPAFVAPETVLGGAVDHRADLYALGCVAYWMLSGRLVYDGRTATEMVLAHMREAPTAPSRMCEMPIGPELDQLVLNCLAKAPGDRVQSADELWHRLDALPTRNPWTARRAHRWWDLHLPELMRARRK